MYAEVPKIQLKDETAARWADIVRTAVNGLNRAVNYLMQPKWNDLTVPESLIRPGATAPALTAFKGNTRLWAFNAGDTVEMAVQTPHGFVLGSELRPHIHISYPNATVGNQVWTLEYTIGSYHGLFTDAVTIETETTPTSGIAFRHEMLRFPAIPTNGMSGLSIMFVGSLKRKSGVSGDYGSRIYLLEFDLHHQVDSLGSAQETSR